MTDLSTKLDQIEDDEKLNYVLERADVTTDKDGYTNAGISKPTFYRWSRETRKHLNKLALQLKLETALKAKLVLKAATKEAAEIKVEGMKSRNERIRQGASTEILDRMLGKPTQETKVDVTTKGEKIKDDPKQVDRAISTFADAIGKIISRQNSEEQSAVDASEHSAVVSDSIESG